MQTLSLFGQVHLCFGSCLLPADILPLVVEIPAWQACRSRFFLLILSDAEHCVLVLDMLPKAPHESFWVHLFPSASPSAEQMVYFLERGERGLTKLDVTLSLEGSLGQPDGLPTKLRTKCPTPQLPLWKERCCGLRDVCWERTLKGCSVHFCLLLAGGTPLEHCSRALPGPAPVADPGWEACRAERASAGLELWHQQKLLWERLWRAVLLSWACPAWLWAILLPSPAPSREGIHCHGEVRAPFWLLWLGGNRGGLRQLGGAGSSLELGWWRRQGSGKQSSFFVCGKWATERHWSENHWEKWMLKLRLVEVAEMQPLAEGCCIQRRGWDAF